MNKNNFQLTVFLGDIYENVAIAASKFDRSAFLLDISNVDSFINSNLIKNTAVYTSLGDLSKNLNNAWNMLNYADTVVYCPPDKWSDSKTIDILDPTDCIQGLTETLLLLLPDNVKIENFSAYDNLIDPIKLVDNRKTEGKQLWIAGCSISDGTGIRPDQRYGQLLADELELPVSFLTRRGSAIDWASDQIIRSNIRKGDIVVWGLTSTERITYVHDGKLLSGVTVRSYDHDPELEKIVSKRELFKQNTLFQYNYAIDRVINFCKACDAQLIMVGLLTTSPAFFRYVTIKENFYQYPYNITFGSEYMNILEYVDLGDDKSHPGPIQHQKYKDFIKSLIV